MTFDRMMTSDEALHKAISLLDGGSAHYPEYAEARARLADSWVKVAEYLREDERDG